MSNIGFVGSYGWPRGICYIYNMLAKTLKTEHKIFLLQRGTNKWSEEFEKIKHVVKHEGYDIKKEFFSKWLTDNKINSVIFNEEQWQGIYQTDTLVDICNELGVKALHYVVWEKFNLQDFEYYEKFDKIICPTKSCYERLLNFGFENVEYVRWGADPKIFKSFKRPKNKKTIFLHVGGYGGIRDRKNTPAVVESFKKLKRNKEAILIITRQDVQNFDNKNGIHKYKDAENVKLIVGTFSQKDLIKLYNDADVIVLPSKWEGNGLPFHESLAMGKPVITIDAPPMNEVIKDGINGLLCATDESEHLDGIFVNAYPVNVKSLTTKMNIALQPELLELMKCNAKVTFDRIWNWNINSKKILKIIKELK